MIGLSLVHTHPAFAARDGGYDISASLWVKAVLQVSTTPVILVWKVVGTDLTPSGDQVISGYFYADPNDFAYGSQYNPELFVKIYIAKSGWCNIAFNHVTVDDVAVYSAHQYVGLAQQSGTASLANRLVENQYEDVSINDGSLSGKIPDTGQTASYTDTFGEDSDYRINPPAYTKLDANGKELSDSVTSWAMVKDNVTGLVWENKTDDGGTHDKDDTYTWQNAQDVFIARLNSERFGGYSDWRLPTVPALSTLVHADKPNSGPTIDTAYFQHTMPTDYWSSTTNVEDPEHAWLVSFYYGSVFYNNRSRGYHVRAVRGAQPQGNFVDNGDGTVTDTKTGLMWQQDEAGAMSFEDALTYSEDLQLADHSDWRLPNRNELQSLLDYSKNNPAIDTVAFPGAMSSYYWSSTTVVDYQGFAWRVEFGSGYVHSGSYKSTSRYVRAVRGGQVASGNLSH